MVFISHYPSPLGPILLSADDFGITGLWFQGQKHFPATLNAQEWEVPFLAEARRWLDVYFSGEEPDFLPPLHPSGTAFQREIWDILLTVPYGNTTTYGKIAQELAARKGLPSMSAQAVGNAVGRNPISLLIPCHRVIGTNGSLTGYAGGLDKKRALLELEHGRFTKEDRNQTP